MPFESRSKIKSIPTANYVELPRQYKQEGDDRYYVPELHLIDQNNQSITVNMENNHLKGGGTTVKTREIIITGEKTYRFDIPNINPINPYKVLQNPDLARPIHRSDDAVDLMLSTSHGFIVIPITDPSGFYTSSSLLGPFLGFSKTQAEYTEAQKKEIYRIMNAISKQAISISPPSPPIPPPSPPISPVTPFISQPPQPARKEVIPPNNKVGWSTESGTLSERHLENQDRIINNSRFKGVADGMGGYSGGTIMAEEIKKGLDTAESQGLNTVQAVKTADAFANARRAGGSWEGINISAGATVCIHELNREQMIVDVANVGDSRFYLIREGRIIRATLPENAPGPYLQAGFELNEIIQMDPNMLRIHQNARISQSPEETNTEEQIRKAENKNVLLHSLGQGDFKNGDKIVSHYQFNVQSGDVLLDCTDGVWELLTNEEIAQIVQKQGNNPQQIAQEITRRAIKRAGNQSRDDATVVVEIV